MKIQPIDLNALPEEREPEKFEMLKPVVKSRFKRLSERPFSSVLRLSVTEKLPGTCEPLNYCKIDASEVEPSSVCLAEMVQNFFEENNEKSKCGRNLCNCFNGNCKDGHDDGQNSFNSSSSSIDVSENLKSLVPSASVSERNMLADIARIAETNKISKRKDGLCKKIVTDGLKALGYNASICKSKWEKSPCFPAGKYEYMDVFIESERLLVDIDFRSEFEIARPTKAYELVLQTLPQIFVGKSDRLEKIICMVSEAAEQSLKKRGMPFPPWRKEDYVKSKWLSPYTRHDFLVKKHADRGGYESIKKTSSCAEFELIFEQKCSVFEKINDGNDFFASSDSNSSINPREGGDKKCVIPIATPWEPPEIKPRRVHSGGKIVTGLASLIENKP